VGLTLEQVSETPYGWLLGVGLGPDLIGGFTVGQGVLIRKPHDDYLEVFARLGLVGFAIFLSFLLSLTVPVVATARQPSSHSRFLWWVLSASVAYLVVAAAQPILAFPYGSVPLFTILGAGVAVVDRNRLGVVDQNRLSVVNLNRRGKELLAAHG
jgi:hypothetical protein